MIHLTQLIYIVEGKEDIFHQFEEMAIPTILKYNGQLTLRIRPEKKSIIENNIEVPYEIHMVEFDTEQDFENFRNDKERSKFFQLKQESVKSSILIQGKKLS